MITATEIAPGIHRLAMRDEADLVSAGLVLPASYNLFVIAADQPALINTMMRRSFDRLRQRVAEILDPSSLRYLVVPHHEGDSDGAINEWLQAAPQAVPVATELCAVLSLRDLAARDVRVVADGEVIDLGSHRLRFLHTPYVNQWDSMMVYEEVTGTLFPNDLFANPGEGVILAEDPRAVCLGAAREFGYMAIDHFYLGPALSKIEKVAPKMIAPMHGPALTGHLVELVRAFREEPLTPAAH